MSGPEFHKDSMPRYLQVKLVISEAPVPCAMMVLWSIW
jgi:hypothetical protein